MHINIGTRSSKLALWQAHYIQSLLNNAEVTTSIIEITTKGDKKLDVSLSKIGSKGVFTEELEEKLKTGEIDIAVHSAKDLQSNLDSDLELLAFTEREKANDVLVALKPIDLSNKSINITIGTSSTRRVAMLKHFYPHISIVNLRGNLQTRFEKLKKGDCDAMMLAYAGVFRMKLENDIVYTFPTEQFIPPTGQGIIAIECNQNLDLPRKAKIREVLNNYEAEISIIAERSFLKAMEGGCSVPTFAYANWKNKAELNITAGIISLNGSQIVKKSLDFHKADADKAGQKIAHAVLTSGGKEILDSIKLTLNQP